MDYLYIRVEDVADELGRSADPLRRAFAKHLLLVANALHDIECVDSDDYAPGREHAAIRAVLGEGSVLAVLLADAEAAVKRLNDEIARVRVEAKP